MYAQPAAISTVMARAFVLALPLCSLFGGCGSSAPIGRVTGEVTCDGAPVEEGIVSFLDGKRGFAAQAILGPGGEFELRSTAGRGLPPGKYDVAILPPTVQMPDTAETEGGEGFKQVDNIPQKYRNAKSSGLVAEVVEGTNHFELAMTGK